MASENTNNDRNYSAIVPTKTSNIRKGEILGQFNLKRAAKQVFRSTNNTGSGFYCRSR